MAVKMLPTIFGEARAFNGEGRKGTTSLQHASNAKVARGGLGCSLAFQRSETGSRMFHADAMAAVVNAVEQHVYLVQLEKLINGFPSAFEHPVIVDHENTPFR
jgi:hypothetical protein